MGCKVSTEGYKVRYQLFENSHKLSIILGNKVSQKMHLGNLIFSNIQKNQIVLCSDNWLCESDFGSFWTAWH